MKISEAAKMTGLSTSNIRFYERKGLLAPVRETENQYRDYSVEDIESLKSIILYRKMNISIETIYLMQKGEVSIESVLKHQEEELVAQREMLLGAIDLCRKIRKEKDPEHLDVDQYLKYVSDEEARGGRFGEIAELLEDFAKFSRIETFGGDPYVGKFFINNKFKRMLSLLVMLICMIVPIMSIILQWVEEETVSGVFWLFWVVWYIGLIMAFIHFRKTCKAER